MPAIRLPIFDQSLFQEPIEKQVKTLADFIMRYRRELEWLLNGQLDESNGVVAADMVITNTLVTNTLYAEYGRIARLSVSELNTAWKKITNYLLKDTDLAASLADVNYIRAYEQYMRWIAAETDGMATHHETDYQGNPLYWTDGDHKGMTTTANDFPVTTWVYTELIKREISFMDNGGYEIPIDVFGAGAGSVSFPDHGKGYIIKVPSGLTIKYIATGAGELAAGTEAKIELTNDGILLDPYPYGLSTTYTTINDTAINITTSEETAYISAFELYQQSRVLIHFTAKIETSASNTVTAKIYVEDRIQDMIPAQTCTAAGSWMLSFQIASEILTAGDRNVKIKLLCATGTASISAKQGQLNITSITSEGDPINYAPTIDVPTIYVPSMPESSVSATVITPTPTYINISMSVPAMPDISSDAELT